MVLRQRPPALPLPFGRTTPRLSPLCESGGRLLQVLRRNRHLRKPSVRIIASDGLQYRRINDEHIQLTAGAMIVNARSKAMFVSEKLGNDQIMIRVAPAATALISCGGGANAQVVAKCEQTLLRAVLVYMPATGSDKDSGKINVLSGEVVISILSVDKSVSGSALAARLLLHPE